jgi:hypothetical protein
LNDLISDFGPLTSDVASQKLEALGAGDIGGGGEVAGDVEDAAAAEVRR